MGWGTQLLSRDSTFCLPDDPDLWTTKINQKRTEGYGESGS